MFSHAMPRWLCLPCTVAPRKRTITPHVILSINDMALHDGGMHFALLFNVLVVQVPSNSRSVWWWLCSIHCKGLIVISFITYNGCTDNEYQNCNTTE